MAGLIKRPTGGDGRDSLQRAAAADALVTQLSNERRDALLAEARKCLKDEDDAEDLVQTSIDKLWMKALADGVGSIESPEGFVRTAMANALKDRRRRNVHVVRHARTVQADPLAGIAAADAERLVLEEEVRKGLLTGLAKLRGSMGEVFMLRVGHECTPKEVTEQTGVSSENARKGNQRAVQKLRRILAWERFYDRPPRGDR